MSETVIKTTEELLALRDKDGVVLTEGDLRIECDVPFSVGKNISGIFVSGNAYFGGNALPSRVICSGRRHISLSCRNGLISIESCRQHISASIGRIGLAWISALAAMRMYVRWSAGRF
jgi:hypothetical protein